MIADASGTMGYLLCTLTIRLKALPQLLSWRLEMEQDHRRALKGMLEKHVVVRQFKHLGDQHDLPWPNRAVL